MGSFKDKVVIVTGAGSGMGETIARDFVEAGAIVAFMGRRLEKLQEASHDLPQERVRLYSCDVSDREAVNQAVSEVIAELGRVDILVNNAGINTVKRGVGDIDPKDWDRVININLTGTFNMVRAVLTTMREQEVGLIINISSMAGIRAGKMAGAAYSASKHGMVSLTNNINQEEWENGIRATAICPGEVDTPILDKRPEPVGAERRVTMVQTSDISASVMYVAGLSQFAVVPLIIIVPSYQNY